MVARLQYWCLSHRGRKRIRMSSEKESDLAATMAAGFGTSIRRLTLELKLDRSLGSHFCAKLAS